MESTVVTLEIHDNGEVIGYFADRTVLTKSQAEKIIKGWRRWLRSFPEEDILRENVRQERYFTEKQQKKAAYRAALPNQKVYLLADDNNPTQYKIGISRNPRKRLHQITAGRPGAIRLIAIIETPDAAALEIELHSRFKSKNISGEWFRLSDEDVQYIQSLQGK
jgi:hypothetical protein